MTDTNTTLIGSTAANMATVAMFIAQLSTGDNVAAIPVTVTVSDLPGKTVWTLTRPNRIGVQRHIVTIVSDPFTNNK